MLSDSDISILETAYRMGGWPLVQEVAHSRGLHIYGSDWHNAENLILREFNTSVIEGDE